MKILILEDDANRHRKFRRNLIGTSVTITDRVSEAVSLIKTRSFDVVFLDYDLYLGRNPESVGDDVLDEIICCPLCVNAPHWVIHSLNSLGAASMYKRLYDAGASVSRHPFAWEDKHLVEKLRAYL